jgi:hypothetical protein
VHIAGSFPNVVVSADGRGVVFQVGPGLLANVVVASAR